MEKAQSFRAIEGLKLPAIGLVAGVLILTIVFRFLDIQASFNSPYLFLALNFTFIGISGFLVAVMAGRAFLSSGIWSALWLGAGSLIFALTIIISTSATIFQPANTWVTAHNTGSLLAGYLHLLGAFFLINGIPSQPDRRQRFLSLIQVHLISIAFLVLLLVLSLQQILPPFFIQGTGGTALRQVVVGLAAAFFLAAGLIFFRSYQRTRSGFLYWYSLGLVLITLGMIGILLQSATGTPLNWTGRAAQMLGGIFLFLAAMVILGESRERKVPTAEVLADLLARTEAKLKTSEERFRLIFDHAEIGIAISDLKGRILNSNPAFENMLGYTGEELRNKAFTEFTYRDDIPRESGLIKELHEGKRESYEVEKRQIRKDGSTIWVRVIGSVLREEKGELLFGLALVSDITRRKQAEEALQRYASELEVANKGLESFNYSVSHDLRQPLRALESFSDLLFMDYRDRLDETGRDYLDRIRKASQYMSELTDDMLKLSRATRAEMYRNQTDLSGMARSIMEELKARQPERKAEVKITPDIMVTGDKALLTIALRNLLENAWKFTGNCQPARIEIGEQEKDGEKIYFIKDNGIGFDMQYAGKLFHPFERLHADKQYLGTGIGLAIVQRIIQRHGGKIWAESEKDRGTAFYFTLGQDWGG